MSVGFWGFRVGGLDGRAGFTGEEIYRCRVSGFGIHGVGWRG